MCDNGVKCVNALTDEVNNYKVQNGAFGGFSDKIHLPCGVRRISPLALAPLKNMKCLVLPCTIEHFAPSDLREPYDVLTKYNEHIFGTVKVCPTSLREVRIVGENKHYRSDAGILYSADGTRLIYLPPYHYNEAVEIAEGVEELGEESCCFVEADKIVFPKTLLRISDRACCASNLKNSQIPSCEIGESAFQGCVLPEYTDVYNEIIPKKAFASCSKLKGVYLHDSVRLIKNEAFSYTDIEKIYIPSTTQIEENAFVREQQRWIGEQVVDHGGWHEVKGRYEYYPENCKNMIIGGEAGSPTEAFANANEIKFEIVGNSEKEIKGWLGRQEKDDTHNDGEVDDLFF